ncbi:hypothetical protein RFI_35546 [Reticulomyxa filosa]|uniref:CCHC-type domain-containing protein n=1 Tax=Reticulomyxa filosa TaxID=46433 RepID=X6LMH5_RETFI|nr:hypothetical protein RFI_35546 [Reticulomyxa filosa]|eukprot:ETO01895.1 hypothetical protein RFI_35546 [Reticulomyxa filosa]
MYVLSQCLSQNRNVSVDKGTRNETNLTNKTSNKRQCNDECWRCGGHGHKKRECIREKQEIRILEKQTTNDPNIEHILPMLVIDNVMERQDAIEICACMWSTLQEKLELTLSNPENKDMKAFKEHFYVVPNLPHNFILSRSSLSQLGYALRLEHEKFEHIQSDEMLEDQDLESVYIDTAEIQKKIECHNIDIETITQNKLVESSYEPLQEYKCTTQKQFQFVSDEALLAQRKYNTDRIRYSFEIGDSVLLFVGDQIVCIKSKLLPKFVCPYTISQRMGPLTLKITSEHSFEKVVHVSKLRKLYIENGNNESEALAEELPPFEPFCHYSL